jgi:hypothetical protein
MGPVNRGHAQGGEGGAGDQGGRADRVDARGVPERAGAGLVAQVTAVVAVAAQQDVGGVNGHTRAEQGHHDLEQAGHGV